MYRKNNVDSAILTLHVNEASLNTLKKNEFIVNFGFGIKVKFHLGKHMEKSSGKNPSTEDGSKVPEGREGRSASSQC